MVALTFSPMNGIPKSFVIYYYYYDYLFIFYWYNNCKSLFSFFLFSF